MTFDYTVDNEPQTTDQHELTAAQILNNAGLDPRTHYLVEKLGPGQDKSFKDTPNVPIHMHQHMKFISFSTAPTPVS